MRMISKRVRVDGHMVWSWDFDLPRRRPNLSYDIVATGPVDFYITTPDGVDELVAEGETDDCERVYHNRLEVRGVVELPDDGPWVLAIYNPSATRVSVAVTVTAERAEMFG